jgi:hypothetical protein
MMQPRRRREARGDDHDASQAAAAPDGAGGERVCAAESNICMFCILVHIYLHIGAYYVTYFHILQYA